MRSSISCIWSIVRRLYFGCAILCDACLIPIFQLPSPYSFHQEYLLSRELDEAASCVRELKAPHFHHELVKRGVLIAMEEDGRGHGNHANGGSEGGAGDDKDGGSSAIDAMAALFQFLVNNTIVSEYQVAKGVSRLRKRMDDIKLDVPAAEELLEEFVGMATEGGFLHVEKEEGDVAAGKEE